MVNITFAHSTYMELLLKNILWLILFIFPCVSYSADTWTGWRTIANIYTYTEEDTLYVNLEGIVCPNIKDYFAIHPIATSNAKQLIAMVLAAKLSKIQVNVLYDPEQNSTYCYFKGLQLKN